MIPFKNAKEIEKAIIFLVDAITTGGNNPKPVILHSMRVGFSLEKLNYPLHIIQAGFLHDTVEDSNATIDQIKEQFGEDVAVIVDACTYDMSITDKKEQYQKAISRAIEMSKESLIVMAADFIQNEPYYDQQDFTKYPWDKVMYFISSCESYLKDEPMWDDLILIKEKYNKGI